MQVPFRHQITRGIFPVLLLVQTGEACGQVVAERRSVEGIDSQPFQNLNRRRSPPETNASAVANVLHWGNAMLERIERIDDYSCMFIKRERIAGRLVEPQYIQVKIRHRPFSVHLKLLAPVSLRGREVVWVEGRNNGKLLTKGTGLQSVLGTISLEPTGQYAMQGNLHPITDIGIRNLVRKMIEVTKRDAGISPVQVTLRRGAKVGKRPCTCIQFDHKASRPGLRYHLSRIFVDDEFAVPIRFEGYTWPQVRGGKPLLVEEYTYTNLKLNNRFTDLDFRL